MGSRVKQRRPCQTGPSSAARMFWPKRIRVLRDGRALTGGGLFRKHPDRDTRSGWVQDFSPALFASGDGGRSWGAPIPAVPEDQLHDFGLTEEFDWVELDGGDLFLVLRAGVEEGRLQTRLRRSGNRWEPAGLPYSGHPELLMTSEGSILHIATTGISCSRDEGQTWEHVALGDGLSELRQEPATPYYPKAIQLDDGEILVVGHVGGDNGYGCVDQSIVGLRLYLD